MSKANDLNRIGMKFDGVRYDTIRLDETQANELQATGRTIAGFGIWQDGTPAFIYIEAKRNLITEQTVE